MPQQMRCPKGHQWTAADEATFAAKDDPTVCPVCGASEKTEIPDQSQKSPPALDKTEQWEGAPPGPEQTEMMDFGESPRRSEVASATALDRTLDVKQEDPEATAGQPISLTLSQAEIDQGRSATKLDQTLSFIDSRQGGTELLPANEKSSKRPSGLASGSGTEFLVDPVANRGNSAEPSSATMEFSEETVKKRPSVPPPGFAYEILGELGRGGMGVVYKARQAQLNRIVALKMILAGGEHASKSDIQRFRTEAEAIAQLQHPNIVQIHEVGERDGHPYFSLEYVGGGSLAQKVADSPLKADDAARLLLNMAKAMDCAHQHGIIHRDLKPANVLLTTEGAPKITDFGLAKHFAEDKGQTRTGAVMGTPSYMSPEQAQGRKEIGPPADIYSLGAILYDLLTGRPPFRGQTVLDTLMQVKTVEPVSPSRLQPSVPRDLETICLKCLEKDASKRYTSAGALADDLERFLDRRPILARPAAPWERAWKWAQRRPAAAGLVVVCFVTIVGMIVGGFAFGIHERHRADEQAQLRKFAEAETERANLERNRAEDNFSSAREAVEVMLNQLGFEQLSREPRMERLRRDLLQKALVFYNKIAEENSESTGMRWEIARAQSRAAVIQEMLGQLEPARKAYDRATVAFKELLSESSDNLQYQQGLADTYNNLGNLLTQEGQTVKAVQIYRDAVELWQKLVQGDPDAAAYLQGLGVSTHNLGIALRTLGQSPEAETILRRAVSTLEHLVEVHPTATVERFELARVEKDLASLLQAKGRLKDADTTFHQSLDHLNSIVKERPDKPDYRQELAACHYLIGNLLKDSNPDEAEKAYQRAQTLRQQLTSDYPGVPIYRQELAAVLNQIGILYQAAGRDAEAEKNFALAMAMKEKLAADLPGVPDYRRDLAKSYNDRGIQLQTHNQPRPAEKMYRDAIEHFLKLIADYPEKPEYPQELARTYLNLGTLLQATGHPGDAEKLYRLALDRRAELVAKFRDIPDYEFELGHAYFSLGTLLQADSRFPEAEKAYKKAIGILTPLTAQFPTAPDYRHTQALVYRNLGILFRDAKRLADEEHAWYQAAQILSKLADELPTVADYRHKLAAVSGDLGSAQARSNKLDAAEQSFRRAIALLEALEKEAPSVPQYWQDLFVQYSNLVNLLATVGARNAEVAQIQRQLIAEEEKLANAFPKMPELQVNLALTLHDAAELAVKRNEPTTARDQLREAIRRLKTACKLSPKQTAYRQLLCAQYVSLLDVLLQLDDHAGIAGAAQELAAVAVDGWPDYPRVAGALAHSVQLADKDKKLAEPKRSELKQVYGDLALKLLAHATAHGYQDADSLKRNADFDPVRNRDDFKKLLSEIESKSKK